MLGIMRGKTSRLYHVSVGMAAGSSGVCSRHRTVRKWTSALAWTHRVQPRRTLITVLPRGNIKGRQSGSASSPALLKISPLTSRQLLLAKSFSVGGVLRHATKLRYWIFGGTVGGGTLLHNYYESLKESLPDVSWMKEWVPTSDYTNAKWEKTKRNLEKMKASGQKRYSNFKDKLAWEEKKAQIRSAFQLGEPVALMNYADYTHIPKGSDSEVGTPAPPTVAKFFGTSKGSKGDGDGDDQKSSGTAKSKTDQGKEDTKPFDIEQEMAKMQMQYQKEIERLEKEVEKVEKENRELRRQQLLRNQGKTGQARRRSMKTSLIDMYSEVLDELTDFDSNYNSHDHLPRVVVVGDQSSGKTSVLEMIAQARIFPRGSGEMMTRSPVQVTLSEGPFHVARFKDSSRDFDLTKESELAALRKEVELRMKGSIGGGSTVSSETISMSVKGPGLPRMVLVDLPGIISTVTTGMANNTRETIQGLCKAHMENPNAIILCIQDGSLDAERSNVTDLVSTMDPQGKRTIFVLTKVDLAETNLYDPDRIKKILEGRLFPMKALGYFAVVTGKGNAGDSIKDIRAYEEEFFRKSKLFKEGVLKPTQMTTKNMSRAVSHLFWSMVKDSVEVEADTFRAKRYNLESEWKNTFSTVRELDRFELFEKAKGEMLDELVNLSQVTSKAWEDAFNKKLWEHNEDFVIESVYLPAAHTDNPGAFNTAVDISLRRWASKTLPEICVQVGEASLKQEFTALLGANLKGSDPVGAQLKASVVGDVFARHQWDSKAEDSLRIIQQNSLEDMAVHDKAQWEAGINFMEEKLKNTRAKVSEEIAAKMGPGWVSQWATWKSPSEDQRNFGAAKNELEKLLKVSEKRNSKLTQEEVTTARSNLMAAGVTVSADFIEEAWHHLYRLHFMEESLKMAGLCRRAFTYYQKGYTNTGIDCKDVVLFTRIQRMLQATSNNLRQQVVNNEGRRLEKVLKEVLEEYGEDRAKLTQLLTGKRVELAEQLKRVRAIQDRLEEFIKALNKEK